MARQSQEFAIRGGTEDVSALDVSGRNVFKPGDCADSRLALDDVDVILDQLIRPGVMEPAGRIPRSTNALRAVSWATTC